MGKIYHFPSIKKESYLDDTLSDFFRKIKKKNEKHFPAKEEDIFICTFPELKDVILQNINNTLLDSSCFNSSYFHCGLYIAKLIVETAETAPKSFYAIDYLQEIKSDSDYYGFKKAGDICFLICSIFTGRCNHGIMTYNSYSHIGKSMYANFYSKSKREIAYLMSDNYEDMAKITRVAISTLLK